MPEIKSIRMLRIFDASNRDVDEPQLYYPGLLDQITDIDKRKLDSGRTEREVRFDEAWSSPPGSLLELRRSKQFAYESLARTALQLNVTGEASRDLWADRFTESSVELYGQPDRLEAIKLMAIDFRDLSQLIGKTSEPQRLGSVLDEYWQILNGNTELLGKDLPDFEADKELAQEFTQEYLNTYDYVLDLLKDIEAESLTPKMLQTLFQSAIELLSEREDPSWSEWSSVLLKGANVSVSTLDKQIVVGERRKAASHDTALKLLLHELLTHALRSNHGYRKSKRLGIGLAGYEEFDEGLSNVNELGISAGDTKLNTDRYLDMALAMGLLDGRQRTRQEMFNLVYNRSKVRQSVKPSKTEAQIIKESWIQVYRIYRGGPGDKLGSRQAIFTRDKMYYDGYRRAIDYIRRKRAQSLSMSGILNLINLGKFDPTNDQHLDYLIIPDEVVA